MELSGLYAITAAGLPRETLLAGVDAALRGGARLVQYRDKQRDHATRLRLAEAIRSLCRTHAARFIVNDDVSLAHAAGADGVHLGRDDAAVVEARKLLGRRAVIGVSCYNEFSRARVAQTEGADYVAFGSFFPSPTKPDAVRATAGLLTRARDELKIPVCAIGGITPDNGAALVRAGANMLAVVQGLFAAGDTGAIEEQARRYAALFAD